MTNIKKQKTKKERLEEKFRVGRSSAGLGLFAKVSFKRDEKLLEYTGEMITGEEADRRGGKYLFEIGKKHVIDGKERGNIARYINHSCSPNAEPEIDGRRVFVYAIKSIKEGDEITYNYGKEYYDDYIKPHGCRCEAKKHLR
ncbi:MAG: SET domain-containing protein [Candidatus Paceibacterota bacterium]